MDAELMHTHLREMGELYDELAQAHVILDGMAATDGNGGEPAAAADELAEVDSPTAAAAPQTERGRKAATAAREIEAELAGRLARLPQRLSRQLVRIAHRWPNPVARLAGGTCGSCGYSLPTQEAIDADRERRLVTCPGCGRFVVAGRGIRAGAWT